MADQLEKTYDPTRVQDEVLTRWAEANAYHAEPNDPDRPSPFVIVIPPPNVTAALHLGHALNNTLQDVLIRWRRMAGDNAVWIPGTDHAGIATQTVVDKRLVAEGKPALKDYKKTEAQGGNGREQFVAKVQAWKDEYEKRITEQLQAMGCSCDYQRQAFTMDPVRAKAVREAFFKLFQDGLIYRGKRLVNWDPVTQTALADDEVEMQTIDGHFWYMKYPIVESTSRDDSTSRDREGAVSPTSGADSTSRDREGAVSPDPVQWRDTGRFVTVATTRPETMLGDTAVAVNPNDPEHAHLIGRYVRLPIVNRIIPIIGDDYVVIPDPDSADDKARFASGFLKVTPAHDPNDYEIGQRHDLRIINVMAPDATISRDHGWPVDEWAGRAHDPALDDLLGMDRYEARKAIVQWFEQQGLMDRVRDYRHAVGHSYRSHVPIEPYLSDQWYVKVTDDRLSGAALRAMAGASTSGADSTSRARKEAVSLQAYFLTYSCYGHWLHGDERGSVHSPENRPGDPLVAPNRGYADAQRQAMQGEPFALDHGQRQCVLQAIKEVCDYRRWRLHAANVRTSHVHVVVEADVEPEKTMNDFKAYATRRMREQGLVDEGTRVWARHGSTRYLNDEPSFVQACRYSLDEQGEDLGAVFDANDEGAGKPLPHGRGSLDQDYVGQLRFIPQRYARTFQNWHENIRDWCISRQLWWGHRIPVWSGTGDVDWLKEHEAEGTVAVIASGEADADDDSFSESIEWHVCLREDDPELIAALESAGFTQDPDVLDTWFSSALWPLSTLGWPDETAELAAWNPTSVLSTAREIITLWVSRMVMFNIYFRGSVPFYDVFIHAMIQDGQGQKMSKSLGNGVDPLDIIHSHGADAMRFTLAKMTTHTQDVRMPVDLIDPHTGQTFEPTMTRDKAGHVVAAAVQESPFAKGRKMVTSYGLASGEALPTDEMPLARNTSSKFDEGRNFCNKLWNAGRFALATLGGDAQQQQGEPEQDPRSKNVGFGQDRSGSSKNVGFGHDRSGSSKNVGAGGENAGLGVDQAPAASQMSLADRWIVSRLARTVDLVDQALTQYEFNRYAQQVYDFFWRDLCDWYLEAIKPVVREGGESAKQARAVLGACLDASLRILHPIAPFITERLFAHLNSVQPGRGLPGLSMGPSELCMRAPWPQVEPHCIDESAEQRFELAQQIITLIRDTRNTYKVPPRQTLDLSMRCDPALTAAMPELGPLIEHFAAVRCVAVGDQVDRPDDAAAAVVGETQLFLHGLVDAEEERKRLTKREAELVGNEKALAGRLNNKGYVEKAPAHLVEQTRSQLAEVQAELETVRHNLAALNR